MDEFPRMMYKFPGAEEIHGARFDTRVVQDEDEQEQAVSEGWAMTTDEARAPKLEKKPEPADEVDRDALKAKATEIGLDFPKNVPSEKLAEMIAQAEEKA